MTEASLVVDRLKLKYEGLFNSAELYSVISSWFFEKGWDWYEKMNQEQVTANGKQIRFIFEPWKSSSDYHKAIIKIKMLMTDVREVEVEQEGKNLNLSHGEVKFYIDAILLSDRNEKWHKKPLLWLMSIMFEKYLYKQHQGKMRIWIKSDVDDLYNKIRNYLNTFKYTYHS